MVYRFIWRTKRILSTRNDASSLSLEERSDRHDVCSMGTNEDWAVSQHPSESLSRDRKRSAFSRVFGWRYATARSEMLWKVRLWSSDLGSGTGSNKAMLSWSEMLSGSKLQLCPRYRDERIVGYLSLSQLVLMWAIRQLRVTRDPQRTRSKRRGSSVAHDTSRLPRRSPFRGVSRWIVAALLNVGGNSQTPSEIGGSPPLNRGSLKWSRLAFHSLRTYKVWRHEAIFL